MCGSLIMVSHKTAALNSAFFFTTLTSHKALLKHDQVHLVVDDVEDIPGLLSLLRTVQRSCMQSRERSGRRPGNEASGNSRPLLFKYVHNIMEHSMTSAIQENS